MTDYLNELTLYIFKLFIKKIIYIYIYIILYNN